MNKLPLIERGDHSNQFKSRAHYDVRITTQILLVFVAIVFLVLFSRLFELTIAKGDYYRRLSDENRIREIIIEPKRGTIIDTKGQALATVEPKQQKTKDRIELRRVYREPESIAPLVGYRQIADENDLKNDLCFDKSILGDKVGKKGIEKLYECDLRGKKGKKLIELDARGKQYKVLTIIPPENGKTIQLGLDLRLQKKAKELLKDKKGAVIGLIPKTGEIITLFSSPSYNIQDFEDAKNQVIQSYLRSDAHPLFNRATEGVYPPGSIYKLFVATGALEEKKIDTSTIFEDTGTIQAGPITFGNWYFLEYGRKEGEVDIIKALQRSNDIFFYRTGARLGVQHMKKWSEIFGLGHKINMSLEQAEGTIPSPYWKRDILNEDWFLGDTYNMAIGQGYLSTTPMQIAMASSVFANNGSICAPQFLKDAKSDCKKLPISQKTIDLVRKGMKAACTTGGTGWPLFEFKVKGERLQVGCKTGTAESHSKSKIPHAWFTVFAPFDKPEVAFTILVENSGQGSDVAAPIAKELLQIYFEGK